MTFRKYFIALLVSSILSFSLSAQTPPLDSFITPYAPTGSLSALSNDDYTVQVRLKDRSEWVDLYEYLTYVNSSQSNKLANNWSETSFVNFDFKGEIVVRINCNYCLQEGISISSDRTVIRPLSKEIKFTVDNVSRSIEFTLSNPQNLSIEINGDRYRNVHLFANAPDPGPPSNPDDYTSVDEMLAGLEKNRNRKNDPDKVWYYAKKDNEVIYIGGNEVFRGAIRVDGKKNVTIRGRGIIDHQGMDKNYSNKDFPPGYDFLKGIKIKNTTNTTVDGIIITNTQQNPIHTDGNRNMTVRNVKIITHAKWGGNLYISSSNGVLVENCFFRASDDCVPITPIFNGTYGNTKNVIVRNSSLYADVAHPIVLGWVGSNKAKKKGVLDNILFENIDILEHDEAMEYFQGAIAVHCGEQNICQNITFRDIRIEDFTSGSLINLIVEPKGGNLVSSDGYRIQNITFDNIRYNGSGERQSKILGLSKSRYINGVQFNDVFINGKRIDDLKDYQINGANGFITNQHIHDISFNKPVEGLTIPEGTYYIQNKASERYLNNSQESFLKNQTKKHIIATSEAHGWEINMVKEGFYTIKSSLTGDYLTSTKLNFEKSSREADAIITAPANDNFENQKWKFIQTNDGLCKIVNANGSNSPIKMTSTRSKFSRGNTYIGTGPSKDFSELSWSLIRIN